jgi:hypothetical protein
MPNETGWPKFLIDLLAEVEGFDADLFRPKEPLVAEDGDEVIGDISPWCRKAYAFVRHLNRQGQLLVAEREYNSLDEISRDAEVCELRYKASLLNDLLYAVLRSEHQAYAVRAVGIREGWKFVSTNPDDDNGDPIKAMILGAIRRMKEG